MPDFKVILDDDDPETSPKLTYLLNRRADDFAVVAVPTAQQTEKLLRHERFDLGLVSNQLRGQDGLAFILAAEVRTQTNSYNGLIALADYALYRKTGKAKVAFQANLPLLRDPSPAGRHL